jgi:hypothetical protein
MKIARLTIFFSQISQFEFSTETNRVFWFFVVFDKTSEDRILISVRFLNPSYHYVLPIKSLCRSSFLFSEQIAPVKLADSNDGALKHVRLARD